jgi:tripartite ATP-independent transporter DctM subunit
VATIFAVAAFGAVSGSSAAASAVFAKLAIPEMLKEKYSKALAAGTVAAGSVLDSVIPPSTLLIVYGIITQQSVSKLLVAGFVPGIFSAFVYSGTVMVMALRNPALAPPTRRYSLSERVASLPGVIPIIVIILTIFTAMFEGWATPTEAGALAAAFAFILALVKGTKIVDFKNTFLETAKLTVVIFTIVWSIMIFVLFLGYANLPAVLSSWVQSMQLPPTIVLLFVYAVFIVLGMFIDALGILLLTLPIVFPLVTGLGYDPIWFGVIVVKLCGIGLLSPPFGLCCFIVNSVRPDIPLHTVFRGVMPFIVADLIAVAVLTAFPGIITFILKL